MTRPPEVEVAMKWSRGCDHGVSQPSICSCCAFLVITSYAARLEQELEAIRTTDGKAREVVKDLLGYNPAAAERMWFETSQDLMRNKTRLEAEIAGLEQELEAARQGVIDSGEPCYSHMKCAEREKLGVEIARKDEALRRIGCRSPKCEAKYETCFVCAALRAGER